MSKNKPHVKISEADRQEMIRLSKEEHLNSKQIAQKFGCNYQVVQRIVKSNDHRNSNAVTREQINDMLVYRDLGLSNKQISIEMGISYESVLRHIGRQPLGSRSEYGSIVSHVTGETYVDTAKLKELKKEDTGMINAMQQAKTIATTQSSLVLESIVTSYKGHSCSYKYSDLSKQIRITAPNGDNLTIMKEDFLYFANEVFELAKKLT